MGLPFLRGAASPGGRETRSPGGSTPNLQSGEERACINGTHYEVS